MIALLILSGFFLSQTISICAADTQEAPVLERSASIPPEKTIFPDPPASSVSRSTSACVLGSPDSINSRRTDRSGSSVSVFDLDGGSVWTWKTPDLTKPFQREPLAPAVPGPAVPTPIDRNVIFFAPLAEKESPIGIVLSTALSRGWNRDEIHEHQKDEDVIALADLMRDQLLAWRVGLTEEALLSAYFVSTVLMEDNFFYIQIQHLTPLARSPAPPWLITTNRVVHIAVLKSLERVHQSGMSSSNMDFSFSKKGVFQQDTPFFDGKTPVLTWGSREDYVMGSMTVGDEMIFQRERFDWSFDWLQRWILNKPAKAPWDASKKLPPFNPRRKR